MFDFAQPSSSTCEPPTTAALTLRGVEGSRLPPATEGHRTSNARTPDPAPQDGVPLDRGATDLAAWATGLAPKDLEHALRSTSAELAAGTYQLLVLVAEFDRRVTVMKLRAARERKRSRGERCEGRKPFGTRPGEAETLARIRELRRTPPNGRRLSLRQVCDTLNAEGLATRSGKPWSKQAMNRILGRVSGGRT